MTEGAVAGVDWAKDAHEVLVADSEGERLWGQTVSHDEAGIARLCRTLVTLRVARVAVERPDGLLIERLLDAGLTVLAIHPNMVAAARHRFRAPAGSPTGSTHSCSASWPGPTATASARWLPTATRPKRSEH